MPGDEPDDAMPRLAVHARTVLAGARHALLTLPGAGVRGWTGLIDDGGEPVLLVGVGSPPTLTAGARCCRIDVPGASGERLVLSGRLRTMPGSAEQIARRIAGPGLPAMPECADAELVALALSVDEVLLCLPTPAEPGVRRRGGRAPRPVGSAAAAQRPLGQRTEPPWPSTAGGRRIDLDAYALAEPDLIAAYACDLIDHLNTAHTAHLLRIAAHGRPVAPAATAAISADAAVLGETAVPGDVAALGETAAIGDAAGLGNTAGPGDAARPGDLAAAGTVPPPPPGDPSDPADVVGVAVAALDRTGLTLWQVDTRGAHELRVTFHDPLMQPRSLGLELRRLLVKPAQ